MTTKISEFLKNLQVGDTIKIVHGDYDLLDNELSSYQFKKFGTSKNLYKDFIGEVAEIVHIDLDWEFPISLSFINNDLNEKMYDYGFDLWHESQIEYY